MGMADRETVITHLQIIHTWAEFSRERDLNFFTKKHLEDIAQWAADALELLKEQKNQDDEIQSLRKENNDIYKQFHEWIKSIVKCKDCKHRDPEDKKCDSGHGILWQLPRDDNWFCADGKRRRSGNEID